MCRSTQLIPIIISCYIVIHHVLEVEKLTLNTGHLLEHFRKIQLLHVENFALIFKGDVGDADADKPAAGNLDDKGEEQDDEEDGDDKEKDKKKKKKKKKGEKEEKKVKKPNKALVKQMQQQLEQLKLEEERRRQEEEEKQRALEEAENRRLEKVQYNIHYLSICRCCSFNSYFGFE